MSCLLEIWIQVAGIYAAVASYAAIFAGWFREFHRFDRTRLVADVFVDALNLWCIYEGALYTHRFVAVEIEHITTTDELVGSRSVEDGLGVDGRSYLEGNTAREVRLDVTGDDAGGRTLGSDDHVDTRNLDPYFEEAAHAIVLSQQGSTSMIQRRFSIGYNRAGRLMDQLEAAGIVGAAQGSKPREVLLQDENQLNTLLMQLRNS